MSRNDHRWFCLFAACLAASAWGWGCRDDGEARPEADLSKTTETIPMNLALGEEPPSFEFPDSLRSNNESLNRFLDEFRGICERGEYERYRLAVSRQIDPIHEGRFENIWHAVKHVRIELIKRLPAEVKELPAPAYAVMAKVTLREEYVKEEPHRYITIVAFREEGEWVFAPSPDERVNRAMRVALRQAQGEEMFAASQPAGSQPAASQPAEE